MKCNFGLISPLGANEITSMELKELWLLMRYFYSMNLVAVKFSLDNAHFAVQILLWVIYLIISRPSADCDCSEKKKPIWVKEQNTVPSASVVLLRLRKYTDLSWPFQSLGRVNEKSSLWQSQWATMCRASSNADSRKEHSFISGNSLYSVFVVH